jgi:ribosomal protein S12 methylthiotransferase accessory factor
MIESKDYLWYLLASLKKRILGKGDAIMAMEISFPGGKKVDAIFKGFTIKTDQSEKDDGEGSAPTPTFLFLASLGTCAGIYALNFCEKRKIDTEKLKLTLEFESDQKTHMIKKVKMRLALPPSFPEKYIPAIVRAMDLCYVKKHLHASPEFETITQIAD